MPLPATFLKVWIGAVVFPHIGPIRRGDDDPLGVRDGDAEEVHSAAPCISKDLRGLPPELVCRNLPGRALLDELTEPGPTCDQRHPFLLLMDVRLQECLAVRRDEHQALIDLVADDATGEGLLPPRTVACWDDRCHDGR